MTRTNAGQIQPQLVHGGTDTLSGLSQTRLPLASSRGPMKINGASNVFHSRASISASGASAQVFLRRSQLQAMQPMLFSVDAAEIIACLLFLPNVSSHG